jgi:hypothetical protein
MVILADGEVMAVGGTQQGDDPSQTVLPGEIWNPDTKQWTTVASMSQPRQYHSAALLLPDGRVLAAGGEPSTVTGPVAQTAQVYSPPYLFKGPRPVITAASAKAGYGTAFAINTPDAASIDSVALIRPSAVTHTNNMEERYVPLAFTRASGSLTATAPANGNVAPPGWYMLVVKSTSGVPSIAKWIQIGQGLGVDSVPTPAPGEPGSSSSPPDGSGFAAASSDPLGPPPISGDRPQAPHRDSWPTAHAARPPVLRSVTTPARVTTSGLRRHGLAAIVRVGAWADARPRLIRLRLYRVGADGRRTLIAGRTRSLRRPQTLRLALPTRVLRARMRRGRYELQLAFGRNLRHTAAPVRRQLTVLS